MMDNSYVKKAEAYMLSFTMPCSPTPENKQMTEQACRMRIDELNNQAAAHNKIIDNEYKLDRNKRSEMRHHCHITCEVEMGLTSIRVNMMGGNAKDAMMIGYNFCALQMIPTWKEKAR